MKKILKRIAFLVTLSMVFTSLQFVNANSDIPNDISGKWYEQAAKNAIEKGWVTGYPDGTFRGDNNVTRAEFIAIINRMIENTNIPNIENKFIDVNSNDWYYSEVLKGIELGIINGYEDGTFKPNNNILRQDAILILSRLETLTPNILGLASCPDEKDISDYATQDVLILYTMGIVKGDENGYIYPQNNITRAEAVALIERTYNYINDLLPEYIEPQFAVEKDSNFKTADIILKNSDDLVGYQYRFEFDSPKELNVYNYVQPLYDIALTANHYENQFSTIRQRERNIRICSFNEWEYMYMYDGYIPKKGEKITMKVTMINAKGTITKDYYIDWIVD